MVRSVPFTAMPTNRHIDAVRVSCPCLFVPAGVAVFSTSMATTAQRAADQWSWAGEGFAVESAVAQICREGGARVSTNVILRDSCGRTTFFGGCQLALDATLVSPFHGDGTHRRRAITDVAVHVGMVTPCWSSLRGRRLVVIVVLGFRVGYRRQPRVPTSSVEI